MNAVIVNPGRNNAMSLIMDLLKEHHGEAHLKLTPDGQIEMLDCGQSISTNGAVVASQLSGKELIRAALDELHRVEPGTNGGVYRALRNLSSTAGVGGLDQAWLERFPLDPMAEGSLRAWLEKSQTPKQSEVVTNTNDATEHEPDG